MVCETTREFVFLRVYDMAALVEACVANQDSFVELDWENEDVLACLARPRKLSLLHYYIFAMISVQYRDDYHHHDDLYQEAPEMRSEVEDMLEAYEIDYEPYDNYSSARESNGDDYDRVFWEWFLEHETGFERMWEKMTDEVFHLLFGNRAFLLQFNESLAEFIGEGRIDIPPDYRCEKGMLKRHARFPIWLRKAIFYRDQGKCVLCQRDLTGLISPDLPVHLDHIVPLHLWGTNDPCNIQLLCADCNRRKSGRMAVTATRYQPWWDY